MTWNYRSYGKSGGSPDPYTCMHDAEAVLKFTMKKLGLRGKIGVFGRSLGGSFATHLAANYPKHIEFLMVDRSFSSLEAMGRNALAGSCNGCLLDTLGQGWTMLSAKNFYKAECFKLLTQDPHDNIVDQLSALSSQVASEACEDLLGENRYQALKVQKAFNAIQLLYTIDVQVNLALKARQSYERRA